MHGVLHDMNHHHNTTNESGQLAIDFERKAKRQEDEILKAFIMTEREFCPSDMLCYLTAEKHIYPDNLPITSVRRGMSNLTKAGQLIKTDQKVNGSFGRPEYLWKLAK